MARGRLFPRRPDAEDTQEETIEGAHAVLLESLEAQCEGSDGWKRSRSDWLAGLVVKQADSPYQPGKRSDAWLKVPPTLLLPVSSHVRGQERGMVVSQRSRSDEEEDSSQRRKWAEGRMVLSLAHGRSEPRDRRATVALQGEHATDSLVNLSLDHLRHL
eukprot:753616-Hanusia_phi.AAC.3